MNPQPRPPGPTKRWGGHYFKKTRTRGIWRCRCGAECMVVVRVSGLVATMRAFNLYRYPLLKTTAPARGIVRAKGYSVWTPINPRHVTRRR